MVRTLCPSSGNLVDPWMTHEGETRERVILDMNTRVPARGLGQLFWFALSCYDQSMYVITNFTTEKTYY